jgi:hypothetical protein
MTMQDRYNSFQPVDDELQSRANAVLAFYDKRDAATKERDSLLTRDSTNKGTFQSRIAELNATVSAAQQRIDEYERGKAGLDSLIEKHRQTYQDKYGNQEIHRQIMEAQDKLREIFSRIDSLTQKPIVDKTTVNLIHYPLLISEKRIPLTTITIPTIFYNSVVLLCISLVAVGMALVMLGLRERILDAFFRLTKVFQRGGK